VSVFRSAARRRVSLLTGAVSVVVLVTSLLAAPAPAATPCTTPPETFPVDQLHAGMVGVGYTVIQGQSVVPFDVQVLGVLPDAYYLGVDVIVVKATGPSSFTDVTGGAVAGMSGSPVYVNGKLAGAVAWAIAEDRMIYGLTEAEAMMSLFDVAAPPPTSVPSTIALTPKVRRAVEAASDAAITESTALQALPVPLGVSGLTGMPLDDITAAFAEHGISVSPFRAGSAAAPTSTTLDPTPLLPGEGYGIGLAYGDVSWYGFGTVTAVCGDTVIGLGHPMLDAAGEVSLGLNEVNVIAVDNGVFWGTKIGTLGDAHGTDVQDRFVGSAGVIGILPPLVPISSDMSSPDTGQTRHGESELAWTQGWFVAEAAYTHAWANITNVFQKDGAGTLDLHWTITGTREDGSSFTVGNRWMQYNDYGAAYAAWRMSDQLYALAYNNFEPVTFTGVRMGGDVTEENLTAPIVKVRLSSPLEPSLKARSQIKAEPGDRITVEVTLDPAERSTNVVTTFSFKVPKGARGTEEVTLAPGKGRYDWWGRQVDSLDEMLEAMNGGDHLNDLIAKGFGWTGTFPQEVLPHGKAHFWVQVVR
jgi:hypothetical protein